MHAARGPAAWRRRAAALGLGLCIPALAAGVYASLGTPGLPGRPFAEIERPVEEPAAVAAFREPVERLAARLQSDPDDLEGWLLLGRSYVVLQRYPEAADALRQAAALSGGDPEVLGMLGEAIVWATTGWWCPRRSASFARPSKRSRMTRSLAFTWRLPARRPARCRKPTTCGSRSPPIHRPTRPGVAISKRSSGRPPRC